MEIIIIMIRRGVLISFRENGTYVTHEEGIFNYAALGNRPQLP